MTKVLFVTIIAIVLLVNPKLAQALKSLPNSNDDFGLA